ncbi:MAG: tyrosine-type recombinase/integrase [Alphaproteobacteria bacterium]|nr:tyrosine-type recombinase/integrase [Alphaproteobacteria bacterium]
MKLRYLKKQIDRQGRPYFYYRRHGQFQRIWGEPCTAEWIDNYSRIHAAFEPRNMPDKKAGTFAAAAQAYMASPRFQNLATRTKGNYRIELDRLMPILGRSPLKNITRGVIIKLRDKLAESSPRRAIEAIKVVNQVFERARDIDMIAANPAQGIGKPVGYKADPHRQSSLDDIETFLEGAQPVWRRALMVLLHTGLRREDAIRLRREHVRGGRIRIKTSKTKIDVVIPVSSALAVELDRPLQIDGLTLIVGTRGRPIRGDVLSHSIGKEAKRLGIEKPSPLHGLRKNAVMYLIEAGLSVEEVRAITGQSRQMIEHYGQAYNHEKVVDAAVRKLDLKD